MFEIDFGNAASLVWAKLSRFKRYNLKEMGGKNL
jgi:hypothetical protein